MQRELGLVRILFTDKYIVKTYILDQGRSQAIHPIELHIKSLNSSFKWCDNIYRRGLDTCSKMVLQLQVKIRPLIVQ